MKQGQAARHRLDDTFGIRKVLIAHRQFVLRVFLCLLPGPKRGHLGAHQGAINLVIRQQRQGRVIARLFQVTVEKTVSVVAPATLLQIHHHERDLADHVDPAQTWTEFDAVENHRLAFDEHDIAQMQVAMTLTHHVRTPLRDGRAQSGMALRAPLLQPVKTGACPGPGQAFPELAKVGGHGGPHDLGRAEVRCFCTLRSLRMKHRHPVGQSIDHPDTEGLSGQQAVKQRRLGKAAHLHRILEGAAISPIASEHWRIGRARDRNHGAIDFRRQASIQPKFFLATQPPLFQCAEIEKAEIHRFLYLVGITANQQDVRDVRLHVANCGMSASGRPRANQPLLQRGGIFSRHALLARGVFSRPHRGHSASRCMAHVPAPGIRHTRSAKSRARRASNRVNRHVACAGSSRFRTPSRRR